MVHGAWSPQRAFFSPDHLPSPSLLLALTGNPEAGISEGLSKMHSPPHQLGLAYTYQEEAEGNLVLMSEAHQAWVQIPASEPQFPLLRNGSPFPHPLYLPARRVRPSKQDQASLLVEEGQRGWEKPKAPAWGRDQMGPLS